MSTFTVFTKSDMAIWDSYPLLSGALWFVRADGAVIRVIPTEDLEDSFSVTLVEGVLIVVENGCYIFGDGTKGDSTSRGNWRPLTPADLQVGYVEEVDQYRQRSTVEGFGPSSTDGTKYPCLILSDVHGHSIRVIFTAVLMPYQFRGNTRPHFNLPRHGLRVVRGELPSASSSGMGQVQGAFPASRFRLGFELETQRVNGNTGDARISLEFSEDDFNEWKEDKYLNLLSRNASTDSLHMIPVTSALPREVLARVILSNATLMLFLPEEMRVAFDGVLHSQVDTEAAQRRDRGEFNRTFSCIDWCASKLSPLGFNVSPDGSVDGPEIKTGEGGLSPTEFITASERLLGNSEFNFTVDAGCSFHIHLSVAGWEHGLHIRLQELMLKFLTDKVHMWPKSIVHRCAYAWGTGANSYFTPTTGEGKYKAVAFREQGTWEFRLWGGLNDVADAKRCMHLSIAAYNWARKQISEGRDGAIERATKSKIIHKVCSRATELGINWLEKEYSELADRDDVARMEACLRDFG